jgi:RHS repeat-associated protein
LGGTDGLYYYGARWYDSSLNRWTQPDTIVPLATQGVQAWDRYAYVNNNPVKYNDPMGHDVGCPECYGANIVTEDDIEWAINNGLTDTATAYATDVYNIDISNVNGLDFVSSCGYGCYGETLENGEIHIAELTFNDPNKLGDTSPGFFGEVLVHESTHADQVAGDRSMYSLEMDDPNKFRAYNFNEVEAYSENIKNFNQMPSLTDSEKDFISEQRNNYYSVLSTPDKVRVDNGWYNWNSTPPWENAVNAGNYYNYP